MSNAVDYAITTIKNGYAQAIEQGCDKFVCQLTKNNQGFSYVEIQRIKEAASKFSFSIPTHISILPKGKKPTNNSLFDEKLAGRKLPSGELFGLQTIYAKETVKPCQK